MDCACAGILKEVSPPNSSWRSAAMFYSCPEVNYSCVLGIPVMADNEN